MGSGVLPSIRPRVDRKECGRLGLQKRRLSGLRARGRSFQDSQVLRVGRRRNGRSLGVSLSAIGVKSAFSGRSAASLVERDRTSVSDSGGPYSPRSRRSSSSSSRFRASACSRAVRSSSARALIIGTRPLVIEVHDVATGLRVVPLQPAVMPPDVQAQHVAVALQGVL